MSQSSVAQQSIRHQLLTNQSVSNWADSHQFHQSVIVSQWLGHQFTNHPVSQPSVHQSINKSVISYLPTFSQSVISFPPISQSAIIHQLAFNHQEFVNSHSFSQSSFRISQSFSSQVSHQSIVCQLSVSLLLVIHKSFSIYSIISRSGINQ